MRSGCVLERRDELARRAIDANLADLSPYAKRASDSSDGAFIEDFCNWQRIPELEQFVRTSDAPRIAADVIGSAPVRLYHDHVLVKEPGTRQRTPWHQDIPYYNVAGRLNVSMWIPVDPVAANRRSSRPGSHLALLHAARVSDGQAKWFPDGSLAELPDIDADPEQFPVIGWALEPGDAVCFHMLTLHAAGGVSGTNRRRVLSLRFLGEDMVHAVRASTTSPPFPGLADELADGTPLDHPPDINVLTQSALVAATDVIVPIDVGFFSITGLARMVKIIKQVQNAYNPELNILGVLATKYDSRTTLSENTIRAIEEAKLPLFKTRIRISVDIIRAQMERLPVNLYADDSHAAADYAALAEEILPAKIIPLRSPRRQASA